MIHSKRMEHEKKNEFLTNSICLTVIGCFPHGLAQNGPTLRAKSEGWKRGDHWEWGKGRKWKESPHNRQGQNGEGIRSFLASGTPFPPIHKSAFPDRIFIHSFIPHIEKANSFPILSFPLIPASHPFLFSYSFKQTHKFRINCLKNSQIFAHFSFSKKGKADWPIHSEQNNHLFDTILTPRRWTR